MLLVLRFHKITSTMYRITSHLIVPGKHRYSRIAAVYDAKCGPHPRLVCDSKVAEPGRKLAVIIIVDWL